MLTFSVDTTELDRKIAATRDALERDVQNLVKRGADHGTEVAKHGGWKDRTGHLRATIISKNVGWSGQTFWNAIQTQASYAIFVEEDTKPHEIWPKAAYGAPMGSLQSSQTRRGRGKGPHEHVVGRGYALRWKDGAGEHFAGMVKHPGTTGFHFMLVGSKQSREFMLQLVKESFVNLRSVWS